MELKPCPFCDNDNIEIQHADDHWWVDCPHCEISMSDISKRELVERWNKRVKKRERNWDTMSDALHECITKTMKEYGDWYDEMEESKGGK